MSTEKVMNLWFVVVGTTLIGLAIGANYSLSVFTKVLTDPAFTCISTPAQTAWIFSAGLFFLGLVMIWNHKKNFL